MAGSQPPQAEIIQICQPEPLLWFHFVEAPTVLEAVELPRAGWHLARPPVRWHGTQGSYDHFFFYDVFGVTHVAWLPRRRLRGCGLGRLFFQGRDLLRGCLLGGLRFSQRFPLWVLVAVRQLF
jgi:hypothetical protein